MKLLDRSKRLIKKRDYILHCSTSGSSVYLTYARVLELNDQVGTVKIWAMSKYSFRENQLACRPSTIRNTENCLIVSEDQIPVDTLKILRSV